MSYQQVTWGTDFIICGGLLTSSPPFMAFSLHESHSVQNEASSFILPSCNLVSPLSIFGDSFFFVLLDCARCIFHTETYIRDLDPLPQLLGTDILSYTQPSFFGGLPFPLLYKEMKYCKQGFRDEEYKYILLVQMTAGLLFAA